MLWNLYGRAARAAVSVGAALVFAGPAGAQAPRVSRASIAKAASFTVTNTLAPKGGSKSSQAMRVEVKGNKARLDFNSPQLGTVRYVANEKGIFLYIPANKVAQKMAVEGGVDGALNLAFRQINEQLKTAKKVGTGTVNGQPTDVYKDSRSGAMLYVSRNPGFRLPIKTVLATEGGTRTVAVTDINLNPALADARFALPAGTQILEATGAPGAIGVPGIAGAGR